MAKTPLNGFRAVIDRLTPTGTTGTFEEIGSDEPVNLQSLPGASEEINIKTGSDEPVNLQSLPGTPEEITDKTRSDEPVNLQSLPGTPEEITDKTRSDEPGTRLSDQTFQTTFDREPISGDGGDFIPINGDGESLPGAFNGSKSLSDIGDDREPVRSFIKGAVRDLVDRIIVSINSSKRILDRANKYKDYKQEEKQ